MSEERKYTLDELERDKRVIETYINGALLAFSIEHKVKVKGITFVEMPSFVPAYNYRVHLDIVL